MSPSNPFPSTSPLHLIHLSLPSTRLSTMSASAPVLSKRALEQMAESAKSPVASALGKTFSNVVSLFYPLRRLNMLTLRRPQWSETNSNGVINAGLAENVRRSRWLSEKLEMLY